LCGKASPKGHPLNSAGAQKGSLLTFALSIRQPYAEEILRGIKTVEYRSRKTGIVRQRFYIHAAMKFPSPRDVSKYCKLTWKQGDLPVGVIVGTARISRCTRGGKYYECYLADVKPIKRPLKPKNHPQPSWFIPF